MMDLGDFKSAQRILEYGWQNRKALTSTPTERSDAAREKKSIEEVQELEANVLHESAWAAYRLGDPRRSRQMCTEGIEDARRRNHRGLAVSRLFRMRGRSAIGDEPDQAYAGEAAPTDEDVASAIQDYLESLNIVREHGADRDEDCAKLHNNMGIAYTLGDRFDEAADAFEQAGRIRE